MSLKKEKNSIKFLNYVKNGKIDKIVNFFDTHNIKDFDINYKDKKNGLTPLDYAVSNGHTAVIRLLLSTNLIDLNSLDKNGETILMVASEFGETDIVQEFFNFGAKPNIKDNDGNTALMYASQNGHIDTVKLLLKYGAKVNIKNKDKDTALSIARKKKHFRIIKLLEKN